MARKADPDGVRTVAVLTKPDTIERATHHRWLPLLCNDSPYTLRLGYFCVRNSTQAEINNNTSDQGAHVIEQQFFK